MNLSRIEPSLNQYSKPRHKTRKTTMLRSSSNLTLCLGWIMRESGAKKIQSRYSGHLSSRLAWNGHNTTKQTMFPIIWREGLNGHSESMCLKHIDHEWLSIACTFMWIWGLNAVQMIPFGFFVVLSSMPPTFWDEGMAGLFWTESLTCLFIRIYCLGIDWAR